MTKDEALKLALEALEEVKSWKSPTRWDGCFDKEIAAIKEALNGCQCSECQVAIHASDCAVHNEPAYPKGECNCGAQPEHEPAGHGGRPMTLRECMEAEEPEQEPVAWMRQDGQRVTTASDRHNYPNYETRYSIPLYTTPLQRKPLTDEQIEEIWERTGDYDSFARAIEAAHGIKGEA